jgi:hypothetical protein
MMNSVKANFRLSAQANVSPANVKPQGGGRSQKSALAARCAIGIKDE